MAIGAALAVFARDQPEGLARFVPRSRKLLFGLGLTLAFTQLALSSMALPAIQIVKGTLISLVDASLLVLVIQGQVGRPMHKVLTGRFMGSIGKYSYGMYVLPPLYSYLASWNGDSLQPDWPRRVRCSDLRSSVGLLVCLRRAIPAPEKILRERTAYQLAACTALNVLSGRNYVPNPFK